MNTQVSRVPAALLNVDEAADYCGVSTKHIWRKKDSGELPHVRMGRRVLFLESDLIDFIMKARVSS
ncbi:helix-turn-helix domain-containing protein [Pseudonocardia tropica]|uniref:Helix-turn-helix domain-containing protein n=1 Tax=Pseudonocardia tropica TaxID=681289 RepID=A0ABV1JYS7_9PSEU